MLHAVLILLIDMALIEVEIQYIIDISRLNIIDV